MKACIRAAAHREEAADVDAVEVCLDLGDAAPGRQGLHKRHQRARHARVQQADAHVHEKGRCKAPCKKDRKVPLRVCAITPISLTF